jgi:acetone carboxylase gamma subunit
MCGEMMQLRETEVTSRVPGTPSSNTHRSREWVCPECDYFEDFEDGESE